MNDPPIPTFRYPDKPIDQFFDLSWIFLYMYLVWLLDIMTGYTDKVEILYYPEVSNKEKESKWQIRPALAKHTNKQSK